jgi:regulator of RNase E activity RraB
MLEERFQEELVRWEEQLKVRREHGDRLDHPRQVEHFAYFRKLDNAKKVADDLSTIGYEVSVAKAGLFKFSLLATREDALDEHFVQAFKAVLFVVEGNGGTYDGFGAEVVE